MFSQNGDLVWVFLVGRFCCFADDDDGGDDDDAAATAEGFSLGFPYVELQLTSSCDIAGLSYFLSLQPCSFKWLKRRLKARRASADTPVSSSVKQ